ncbi:MAG: hypothetical protein FWD66_00970 [Paludibacter sp.]|nr:hypothetical protein [Paludibacter sp.]
MELKEFLIKCIQHEELFYEFINKLCKKQRENCEFAYGDATDFRPLQIIDKIRNAEQPKIEEI